MATECGNCWEILGGGRPPRWGQDGRGSCLQRGANFSDGFHPFFRRLLHKSLRQAINIPIDSVSKYGFCDNSPTKSCQISKVIPSLKNTHSWGLNVYFNRSSLAFDWLVAGLRLHVLAEGGRPNYVHAYLKYLMNFIKPDVVCLGLDE